MASSPPLLDLMAEQVAERKEAARKAAQAEADRINQAARETGEERKQNALAQVDRELAALAQRAQERAEAESQMVLLTTKDTITDELLDTVQRELQAVADGPEFPAILDVLLAEVIQEGPKDGAVLAPPAHVDHCKQWLDRNGHSRYKVEPLKTLRDGVAVQDSAGTYRVTNTLSARFEKQKNALRKFCIEQLFGDKGTAS